MKLLSRSLIQQILVLRLRFLALGSALLLALLEAEDSLIQPAHGGADEQIVGDSETRYPGEPGPPNMPQSMLV